LHQSVRFEEDRAHLVVADVRKRPPRRHFRRPQTLHLPDVPDATDQALVEKRVPHLAQLIDRPQVSQHRVEVRRLREDVRPDPAGDPTVELEHRSTREDTDVLLAAKHEPRHPEDLCVARQHAPASFHPHVTAQDDPAFEPKQQVLANRVDRLEPPAVEQRRELLHGRARMRCLDLELVADERLQPARRAVNGISLRHRKTNVVVHASLVEPDGMQRLRAASAGAVAATVWGLLEPLDKRLFRCGYSDVELLGRGRRGRGFVVHAANGAIFGIVFDAARRRTKADPRRLALAMALAEHAAVWPLIWLVDPKLVTSPRAFAQSTWRHALFGVLLGRLA